MQLVDLLVVQKKGRCEWLVLRTSWITFWNFSLGHICMLLWYLLISVSALVCHAYLSSSIQFSKYVQITRKWLTDFISRFSAILLHLPRSFREVRYPPLVQFKTICYLKVSLLYHFTKRTSETRIRKMLTTASQSIINKCAFYFSMGRCHFSWPILLLINPKNIRRTMFKL